MFKHIMIATDFSDPAKVAVREGRALAEAFGAKVTLMHVVDRDDPDAVRERSEELLEELRGELLDGVPNVTLRSVPNDHADVAICGEAVVRGADLIVAARHGDHNIAEHFLGSTTERVVRHAGCSVWVAHPEDDEFAKGRPVIACSDLSEHSERAAIEAAEIAERLASPLSLAHVYTYDAPPFAYEGGEKRRNEGMERHATERLDALKKDKLGGRDASLVVREHDSPVAGICDIASELSAGLIVVGTRGRTGLRRLLIGSVAERVVRHAPCSVLVARL